MLRQSEHCDRCAIHTIRLPGVHRNNVRVFLYVSLQFLRIGTICSFHSLSFESKRTYQCGRLTWLQHQSLICRGSWKLLLIEEFRWARHWVCEGSFLLLKRVGEYRYLIVVVLLGREEYLDHNLGCCRKNLWFYLICLWTKLNDIDLLIQPHNSNLWNGMLLVFQDV